MKLLRETIRKLILEVIAKDASKDYHRVVAGITGDQKDYLDDIESSGPEFETTARELAQTLGSKEGIHVKGKEGQEFLRRKALEDSANQVIKHLKSHSWRRIKDRFEVTKGKIHTSQFGDIPQIIIRFDVRLQGLSRGRHAFDVIVRSPDWSALKGQIEIGIRLREITNDFRPMRPGTRYERWDPLEDYGIHDFYKIKDTLRPNYKDAKGKLDPQKLDQLVKDMESGIMNARDV